MMINASFLLEVTAVLVSLVHNITHKALQCQTSKEDNNNQCIHPTSMLIKILLISVGAFYLEHKLTCFYKFYLGHSRIQSSTK